MGGQRGGEEEGWEQARDKASSDHRWRPREGGRRRGSETKGKNEEERTENDALCFTKVKDRQKSASC